MPLTWFCVPNPPGFEPQPYWVRSAAIDEGGTVYAPASPITGKDEGALLLMAAWDQTPLIMADGHVFLPTSWIAREFPEAADLCSKIEEECRERLVEGSDS